MERISRKEDGFQGVSDIPAKYKLYSQLYKDATSNAHIPNELQKNIFAITGEEGGIQRVYLMVYMTKDKRADINSTIRRIIQDYRNDEKTFLYNLVYGEIKSSELRSTIERELKENAKKAKLKRTDEGANLKVEFAQNIIRDAMNMKASDLHIESDEHRAVIRLRVNKELFDYKTITFEDAKEIANIFYATFVRGAEENQEKGSGDGVYLHTNMLDGEFSRVIGKINMKARMVNIGQNYQNNFNMVLRLMDKNKSMGAIAYKKMGYSDYACEQFKVLQTASRGMVLVGGVTGSGKSTFMQNTIMHERDRCGNTRKIYSIEQPIEQKMPRVTQISAEDSHESNEAKESSLDFSFDNINRMLMRGDPDSIAYGEIRDPVTAKASVKGVESGHLVYGTMHIQEALAAFSRFETFNVSAEKICRKSFIKMIIFQHLIPKICPHCSIPYSMGNEVPDNYGEFFIIKTLKERDLDIARVRDAQAKLKPGESLLRALQHQRLISSSDVTRMRYQLDEMNKQTYDKGFKERLNGLMSASTMPKEKINVRFRGDGCKHCFNGTVGVVPAVELLIPDDKFLDLVMSGKMSRAENHWRSKLGGRNATQDTYEKIMEGLVDPRMVEAELEKLGS